MTKKSLLSVLVIVGVLSLAGSALAFGPGYGRGMGYGYHMGPGYGQGMGYGRGLGPMGGGYGGAYDEETAKLQGELYQKQLELNALLAAPEVDEAQAKSVQKEINELRGRLSEKRLAQDLEFQKRNPDLKPGYGPGWGRGFGPGACWR
ncbi:MAG: hypothetical protein AB1896_21290 [Thermodesulfobacteriota bacterium]